MAQHHSYSIAFKRQVPQDFLGGERLHCLAKRYVSRSFIRTWAHKYDRGSLMAMRKPPS
ncbi:hypothetical protein [Ensifer aridi]|uniref:hypothetical protein n=1 Tax=Ensifer aridi TaxID=1708715 RepID=UPI001431C99B|nr:hypothetical protein [Ensifer aridi]